MNELLIKKIQCLYFRAICDSRASYLTCSRTLRALCLKFLVLTCIVPYVFLCLTCLTCSCTSRGLCFACSRAAHASDSTCCCSTSLSLASGVSSPTCSYASIDLQLSCLLPLVLLVIQLSEFFTALAKVNLVIDSSKDTLNINDIDILYPLRVATYVKNEFQNLQAGFKSTRRGLSYVQS